MAASQQDALNAVAAASTAVTAASAESTTLGTDVTAYIAAHPAVDYQPIIDALAPVTAAANTLTTNLNAIDTQVKAAP